MIEVERRALIDETTYNSIGNSIIMLGGVDEGLNSTTSTFYLKKNNWQMKVQHLKSKNKAKIAWKSGGLDGAVARQEIEINIDTKDIQNANDLIAMLSPDSDIFITQQDRHDYSLGDLNIAVKYSHDWRYHIEIDILVDDKSQINSSLEKIDDLAIKLDVTLLTPEEEKTFVESAIAKRAQND